MHFWRILLELAVVCVCLPSCALGGRNYLYIGKNTCLFQSSVVLSLTARHMTHHVTTVFYRLLFRMWPHGQKHSLFFVCEMVAYSCLLPSKQEYILRGHHKNDTWRQGAKRQKRRCPVRDWTHLRCQEMSRDSAASESPAKELRERRKKTQVFKTFFLKKT